MEDRNKEHTATMLRHFITHRGLFQPEGHKCINLNTYFNENNEFKNLKSYTAI